MRNIHKQQLSCSDAKRQVIRESLKATSLKRLSQVCYVYELKIDKKKLNRLQKEQLDMLFVEGKRFYNHLLRLREKGTDIFKLNTSTIDSVVVIRSLRMRFAFFYQL